MQIIKIEALPNGAHENQTGGHVLPDGWIEIPETIELPASFPFVDLVIENGVLVGMTELPVPETPTPEPVGDDIYSELAAAYTEGVNSI